MAHKPEVEGAVGARRDQRRTAILVRIILLGRVGPGARPLQMGDLEEQVALRQMAMALLLDLVLGVGVAGDLMIRQERERLVGQDLTGA